MFKSLYQIFEKRNFTLPCDFQYIYELYHKVDEIDKADKMEMKTMKEELTEICDKHSQVKGFLNLEFKLKDHFEPFIAVFTIKSAKIRL